VGKVSGDTQLRVAAREEWMLMSWAHAKHDRCCRSSSWATAVALRPAMWSLHAACRVWGLAAVRARSRPADVA
jgi:hypothetical protein